jgi:hypothetical protein
LSFFGVFFANDTENFNYILKYFFDSYFKCRIKRNGRPLEKHLTRHSNYFLVGLYLIPS